MFLARARFGPDAAIERENAMRLATALLALSLAVPARAACPSPQVMDGRAQAFLAREPVRALPELSLADGACAQALLLARLQPSLGAVVGYKAGLTNANVQRAFGVDHPVRGTLLAGMLLPDGAEVPAAFAAVPRFESDLLLRVKDAAINTARDVESVARHIDAVIPFIELPDLVLAQGERFDGGNMLAINVGARLGVVGATLPAPPDLAARLAAMTVVLADDTGSEIARGQGAALLGHPLNVVLWLIEDLAKSGAALQPGQLISLGSFSPLTATYLGLTDAPLQVQVRFR
jgi:2-keto-4-pentenoate hydratase